MSVSAWHGCEDCRRGNASPEPVRWLEVGRAFQAEEQHEQSTGAGNSRKCVGDCKLSMAKAGREEKQTLR